MGCVFLPPIMHRAPFHSKYSDLLDTQYLKQAYVHESCETSFMRKSLERPRKVISDVCAEIFTTVAS